MVSTENGVSKQSIHFKEKLEWVVPKRGWQPGGFYDVDYRHLSEYLYCG